jgi:mRNA interferase HigB
MASADPALETALAEWHKIATTSRWQSIVDVRKTFPHADFVDPFTVFNIRGNHYRLIVKIEYRWSLIFVKRVMTHADYTRQGVH